MEKGDIPHASVPPSTVPGKGVPSSPYVAPSSLGLRRGEVCGLSWGDVDFENNVLNVEHSVDSLGNLKGTKTKAGMRLLPMPTHVAERF